MAKPLKDKPIYFVVRKMRDPKDGKEVGCLVPLDWTNRNLMRERHYRINDHVRATLTMTRNVKFHRLVHGLGRIVTQNVDTFENMTSHAAIKRLQQESGTHCHISHINAEPVVNAILNAAASILGEVAAKMLAPALAEIKTIELQEAESIAFDSLDEAGFRQFWAGICEHLVARYWPTMTVEQISEMAEMLPQREAI